MDSLSDYCYHLPEELIAQQPLEDRSSSRLLWLHLDSGEVTHHHFRDLTTLLKAGDLLVVNNTRVKARRLFGVKSTGGKVEALLLSQESQGVYRVLCKPASSIRIGTTIHFGKELDATVIEVEESGVRLFDFGTAPETENQINSLGEVPLPPYITERLKDEERYQTVYSSTGFSAAAPTAGLHFTPEVFSALNQKGIGRAEVCLDIGIDTFQPIRSETLEEHKMHGETCLISTETADAVNRAKGRVLAVGTTVVRTLESMADPEGKIHPGEKVTRLFIQPGYRFRRVGGMITNFHMPGSTMLVMISAFAGRAAVLRAYEEAVAKQYRFLSFGDAMLIL
ncbi:MAG: tRNA preQ1(34) S-adenosylmethionine ribosyltransferase-isomerase QueA [Fimbriimonadaceae bacterium]